MQRIKNLLLFVLLLTIACLHNTEPLVSVEYDIYFCSNRDGQFEIYRMNSNGENLTRITYSEGIDRFKFTADGSYIFYQKTTGGTYDIYKMNNDGTNEQQLTNLSAERISWDVSPDGKILSYSNSKGNYDKRDSLIVINFEPVQIDIYTYIGFNGLGSWYNCLFLWNGDKIVCRAENYAIRVVDVYTQSIRTICQGCIYLDYNWQVFPYEEKVLVQDDHVTFIVDLGIPWSMKAIPIDARVPRLTPDGKGFIYISRKHGQTSKDIKMYDFATQTSQSLRTIEVDQIDEGNESSFAFSPDGGLITWDGADIFRMDIHGDNFLQLTTDPAKDRDPVFQPSTDLSATQ